MVGFFFIPSLAGTKALVEIEMELYFFPLFLSVSISSIYTKFCIPVFIRCCYGRRRCVYMLVPRAPHTHRQKKTDGRSPLLSLFLFLLFHHRLLLYSSSICDLCVCTRFSLFIHVKTRLHLLFNGRRLSLCPFL